MKYLMIISLFIFTAAFAHEECADLTPSQESFESVDDLLNHLDGATDPGMNFKGCNADQVDLLNRSVPVTQKMIRDIESHISQSSSDPNIQRNFAIARDKIDCVKRKMVNAPLTCKYVGGNLGRALKYIGNGIALDTNAIEEHFQKNRPQYTRGGISTVEITASTILHEMTHKCGTNDDSYFAAWNDPMTSGGSEWGKIADTYQAWALWGFCMPGPQCAARKLEPRR